MRSPARTIVWPDFYSIHGVFAWPHDRACDQASQAILWGELIGEGAFGVPAAIIKRGEHSTEE